MSVDNERHFSRKCKLSSLLKEPYTIYRVGFWITYHKYTFVFTHLSFQIYQEIRKVSEEYTVLLRDAMNLVLYSVCFWADNGYCNGFNTFPPVLSHTFWSHCYRSVALGEGYVKRAVIIWHTSTKLLWI